MAEQLQCSSKLDTLVTTGAGLAIGGLVVSSNRLATMSDADRNTINAAAKTAGESLRKIRDQDMSTLGRLKGKMTNTALTTDEDAKWEAIYSQLKQRLGQSTFGSPSGPNIALRGRSPPVDNVCGARKGPMLRRKAHERPPRRGEGQVVERSAEK